MGDIRTRQRNAVKHMLNTTRNEYSNNNSNGFMGNRNGGTGQAGQAGQAAGGENAFKVIVLDKAAREIVGPLMSLQALRKEGVTLHLALENKREQLGSLAPAVYLISPSVDAVRRVAADASAALYASIYVHFTSPASREVIEAFASSLVASPGGATAAARVVCVRDEYLAFQCCSARSFSLLASGAGGGQGKRYATLNAASTSDTDIEKCVTNIVDGMYASLVTMGVVPIIKAQRGGAAEMVAAQLDERICAALQQRTNVFSEAAAAGAGGVGTTGGGGAAMGAMSAARPRPVLFIFDRNVDLCSAVQHGWTYAPLVSDMLGLKANRVDVMQGSSSSPAGGGGGAGATEKKSYELDEDDDFFWREHAASEFPRVAEEVEVQLKRYKADMDEINRSTALENVQNGAGGMQDESSTKNLKRAVDSLPELTARKKIIDKHTNIATALLSTIKERGIDALHNLEEEMLQGASKTDLNALLSALAPEARGTPCDKLRLAIVYVLSRASPVAQADVESISSALVSCGADPAAMHNARRVASLTSSSGGGGAGGGGPSTSGKDPGGNLLDWADKLYGQGVSAVTKGVKSLMSGSRRPPVAAMVDAVMEGKQGADEAMRTLDPRRERQLEPAARLGVDIIVFVVGGGNSIEQQSVEALGTTSTPRRSVVYGCTEMLSPSDFVEQLASLSR